MAQACELTASLEGAARAAARSEVAVDGVQQWLREAAAALRDPGAGDPRQVIRPPCHPHRDSHSG